MVYCDKDDWADREKGLTWANYTATYPKPTADQLDADLSQAAVYINRTIGFIASDVTSSTYTPYLKNLNYHIANRIRSYRRNRNNEGAIFRFSLQDYMFIDERNYCKTIGKILGHRKTGGVVF